jgi:hypothetical protein
MSELSSPDEPIESLQRAKAERLADLMTKRPGQKHYKRALRSFLDVDDALEKAMERKLRLN